MEVFLQKEQGESLYGGKIVSPYDWVLYVPTEDGSSDTVQDLSKSIMHTGRERHLSLPSV